MARPSKFDSNFKAKVAIEALQEKEPLQVLAKKYGVAPSVISNWKEELLRNSSKAFETEAGEKRKIKALETQNAKLERKVGQLTLECDFFAEACEDARVDLTPHQIDAAPQPLFHCTMHRLIYCLFGLLVFCSCSQNRVVAERLEEIEQQIKADPVSAQLVLDSISQYPFHDSETEALFLLYDIFCKYRLDLEEPDDTRISKAERVIMKSGTQHQKMLVLFLHAYFLKNAKQYDQSMMKFKESLVAGENSSDHYLLGQIYTQMSFLCIPNMDIDQLQFAEKALNEYRLLQDSILILDGETNIAIMNFNRHRYELCLDLFGQLAVKSERMGDTLCLGKSLILLSECELKFGKYTSALNHLKKVQSLKTFTYTSHTPTLLAMAYARVGEKDSAFYYLDEASVQANTLSALNTYQEYASKVYTIMEDYKQAFEVYQQLHNRLDSMYAETINRSVMKAQKDFAEKRIGFFEREVRMKNLFSAFLIFVLVAGCAFFIYYRNQQRKIQKLQDDNQKNVLRGMILSTVVTRLKQMAFEETIPSESDWNDLNQLFEEMLPSFERKLRQKNSLSEIEWRICQLEKLGFSNKEVATLICKAKNTISTANAKLFKQRFGVDGGSSGWLDFIQKL